MFGKFFAKSKRVMATFFAVTMVTGLMPVQQHVVKAEDTTPYVVSTGRTAYASSSVSNSDPISAVDGTTSTRWESAWDSPTEWIYVDLGKETDITGAKLYWEGAYAKDYKIQVSNDEENWDDVYTAENTNGGNQEVQFTSKARYVRLYMTKKALTAYGYSLYEFEIYGLNGITKRPVDYGENIAEGKSVSASSLRDIWWMYDDNGVINQTSVLAQNAVDGKSNTSWTSAEKDNQYLTVDLGTNHTIGRVVIDWASDAGKIYDIQTSTDGQNWTTRYRQLNGHGLEVADIPLYATARYVRIYGYTRVESGSGFAITELKVYDYKNGDEHKTYNIPDLPQSSVVSNGKGSYLTNSMYNEKAKLPLYKTDNIDVPIASNDWWQSILINKFGNTLSEMPLKTKYSAKGLGILTATEGWLPDMKATDVNVSVNTETATDFYIQPENIDTKTARDVVSGYGDYSVKAQLRDDDHIAMTTTFVKGSPYIFADMAGSNSFFIASGNITSIFNGDGQSILSNSQDVVTTDHIGIEITDDDNKTRTKNSKSYYCINVPANTVFKKIGNNIKVTFQSNDKYLSVGTMLNKNQIEKFYRHGYAFVKDTKVTYTYDDNDAVVTSNYEAVTELKRGGFTNETIHCMLPHQWKNSNADNNSFATYKSIRGDMKAIEANSFSTVSKFAGLLPTFAMPKNAEFDGEAVQGYLDQLEDATKNLNPAGDAYWEGKNLHPLGMGVLMADQIGNTEQRDIFLKRIKKILVNWFTYDGKDDISYLIYNNHWGTIFYEQSEFGANAAICDHHFTYGYFMFAATVLATYDEEFYNDYKGMIEILIRDYANPSDNDSEYCRFRAYDMYEGHSWAGGYADNDNGNNQESASESLFSWVSMYLWGVLTENDTYRDAGAFGFSNEMEAVEQYWFDYDKDNWINDWPYEVVGQVYGGSNFYGTFFGGQPLYVYGIQWLPISEYLTYYGMNQTRAAEIYQGLLTDTDDAIRKATLAGDNIKDYPEADNGWQHITWPFLSQTNPDLALSKFVNNDNKVQRTDTANTYWFINSMKESGYKTNDIVATGDLSAAVYYNKNTGKYTSHVWNPTNKTKVVNYKNANGQQIGKATIGAKSLVSFEVYKNQSFDIVQAQTPVISVPSGTYDDTQYVEISCPTNGADIYYSTDGSMPNKNTGKKYTGKFAVSSSATVKAIAVKNGNIDSAMATSSIKVDGSKISKDTNLALNKNVVVSGAENATVGGDKVVDNDKTTRWSSNFVDDAKLTIDLGQVYSINKVTINWEASYAKEYKIQTSVDGTNFKDVYVNNAGKGSEEEIIFNATDARYVRMQGFKRALAYGYSIWEMGVYEAEKVAKPTFTPSSGTVANGQALTISSNTKGVEIRYTTDGSEPDENSKLYIPGAKITSNATFKAVALRKGMIKSDVATATYTVDGSNPEPPTPEPPVIGENIAKDKNITSSGNENAGTPASNAVDGNNGTRWSSNFDDDANITVDLGQTYDVSSVVLKWEAAFGKKYKIQVSTDGVNFTTVKEENNSDGGEDPITFNTVSARYVRMQGVERALPYGYSLWEMEVYTEGGNGGTPDPDPEYRDLAKHKLVTTSGNENAGTPGGNAVDENGGSRWSSNFADDANLTIDLGATYSVDKVTIDWEAAYGKNYLIQTSTDGLTWNTVSTITNSNGGNDTITFPATMARYVRMQGVERALPYGYSIWEMSVYGQ